MVEKFTNKWYNKSMRYVYKITTNLLIDKEGIVYEMLSCRY